MRKILGLLVVALLAVAPAANASSIYDLNIDHCTGGCGTGPYVQVTLTQLTDAVKVDAVLENDAVKFVHTGFDATFAFNLAGFPAVTITDITSGWSAVLPTQGNDIHMDGFGYFDYGVDYTGGHGGNGTPNPLSFTVNGTGLTVADFETLSTNGAPSVFFAADVLSANGNTGPVGGGSEVPQVPEPASMLLLGTGLLGSGYFARKRKK
jgi:hypothetical protein